MWIDGKKAYTYNGITCHNGCPDMGYIMILGWMNGVDAQTGYAEYDNIVMSRSYIGPPSTTPPPTLVGDLNSDRIVNSLDWSVMNSVWSSNNTYADLNRDGIVNSLDFSLMNANWGRTS